MRCNYCGRQVHPDRFYVDGQITQVCQKCFKIINDIAEMNWQQALTRKTKVIK
jgi:ribosome-binding protein aMBF1 (putative translation factor)